MAALVQTALGSWAATSNAVFGSNVTAGNLLIAMTLCSSAATQNPPTDTRGNSYTAAANTNPSAAGRTGIWWTKTGSSGTCTVTVTPSAGSNLVYVYEVSGVPSLTPVDVTGSSFSASNTTVHTAPNLSGLSTSTDFVLYWYACANGIGSAGAGPWTWDSAPNISGTHAMWAIYQPSAGPTITGPSIPSPTSQVYGCVGVSFANTPSPPVGGYTGWYDATTITGVADGASLATWSDKSGNSNDLAGGGGSNNPVYYSTTSANLINGLPVVYSNGLQYASSSAAGLLRAQPYTLAFVFAFKTVGAGHPDTLFWRSDSSVIVQATTGPTLVMQAGSNVNIATADTSAHALICVFNGASSAWQYDAATASAVNPGSLGITTSFTVGSNSTIGAVGPIGEVIFWPLALSTTDMASIKSYLTAKWLTPPSINGTATLALGPLTLTSTGTIFATINGTATLPLGPFTLTAAGLSTVVSRLPLGPLTLTATAIVAALPTPAPAPILTDAPLTTVTLQDVP